MIFNLPQTTELNKFIAKDTFNSFLNTAQKKLLADAVQRITWTNKLSYETVNIPKLNIEEIEVFEVVLKQQINIEPLLLIINKQISYQIIFVIKFEDNVCLYSAAKHSNPSDENKAVIDHVFKTKWFSITEINYQFDLSYQKNLDQVYSNFCNALLSTPKNKNLPLAELVATTKNDIAKVKEIERLKTAIRNCKQFNKKVELNLKLKQLEKK